MCTRTWKHTMSVHMIVCMWEMWYGEVGMRGYHTQTHNGEVSRLIQCSSQTMGEGWGRER